MTTYKIETNSNGEIFVVALHGLTTGQNCGGPYKNEESAKRRIRDLKRRDAETIIPEPLETCNLCGASNGHHLSCVTIMKDAIEHEKPTELAEHKPAYGTPNATTLAALGKNEAVKRIVDDHLTCVVFGQSNFASKPMGVYPAVAKKFYRQQWK